jgi:hypothetical protein
LGHVQKALTVSLEDIHNGITANFVHGRHLRLVYTDKTAQLFETIYHGIQEMEILVCLELDMRKMRSEDELANIEKLVITKPWKIRCLSLRTFNGELCASILRTSHELEMFRLDMPEWPRQQEQDGVDITFREYNQLTECILSQLSISQPKLRSLQLYCSQLSHVLRALDSLKSLEHFVVEGWCATEIVRKKYPFI